MAKTPKTRTSFRLERLFVAPWGEELDVGPEDLLERAGKQIARANVAAVFSFEGYLVTLDLIDRQGLWEVSRLEIRSATPGKGVAIATPAFRRRLPLPAMVEDLKERYLQALRAEARRDREAAPGIRAYVDKRSQSIGQVRESRKGRALSDAHFEGVAELYRQRVRAGSRTPNKDLAAELGVASKTVANWVGEARNRNLLPRPSRPGVAEV